MKKYLFLYAVLATALLVVTCRRYHSEVRRLVRNQEALASDVAHYRTRAGQEAPRRRFCGCAAGSSSACARTTPKKSAGWESKSAGWKPPQKP